MYENWKKMPSLQFKHWSLQTSQICYPVRHLLGAQSTRGMSHPNHGFVAFHYIRSMISTESHAFLSTGHPVHIIEHIKHHEIAGLHLDGMERLISISNVAVLTLPKNSSCSRDFLDFSLLFKIKGHDYEIYSFFIVCMKEWSCYDGKDCSSDSFHKTTRSMFLSSIFFHLILLLSSFLQCRNTKFGPCLLFDPFFFTQIEHILFKRPSLAMYNPKRKTADHCRLISDRAAVCWNSIR